MKRSVRLGLAHPSLHGPEPIPPPEVLLFGRAAHRGIRRSGAPARSHTGTGLRFRSLHVLRHVPRAVPGDRLCRRGADATRSWTFSPAAKSSRAIHWRLSGASGLKRLKMRTRARSLFRERLSDVNGIGIYPHCGSCSRFRDRSCLGGCRSAAILRLRSGLGGGVAVGRSVSTIAM